MNFDPSMPLMEPGRVHTDDEGHLIVEMQKTSAEVRHNDRQQEIDGIIGELATEKRGELLSLVQDMSISPEGSSVRIDRSELRFKAKVGELATTAARRLKAGETEKEAIEEQVARQIIKELWPTLCLKHYAKEITAEKIEGSEAQQVCHRALAPENLSQAKTLEMMRLAQKILTTNRALMQQLDVAAFKQDCRKLLEKLGEEVPQEASRSWVSRFIPSIVTDTLSRWAFEAVKLSPSEQIVRDLQFLDRFGDDIRRLGQQRQLIESGPSTSAGDPILNNYFAKLSDYEAAVKYLDDFSAAHEDAHVLGQAITDQIFSLEETSRGHFSVATYEGMIELIKRFNNVANQHKPDPANARLTALVDRTTAYGINQATEVIFDLMEQLLPAMRTEFDEALAHFRDDSTSENKTILFAGVDACNQWVDRLTELQTANGDYPDLHERVKGDLDLMIVLQHDIKERLEGTTFAEVADESVDVEALREGREVLTSAQAKREWHQHYIAQVNQPLSDTQKTFLNLFFFLLQAGAPILGAMAKPVARMDYNYYLGMMAEAAHGDPGSTPESYDFYLARAKEFWGGNEAFLDSYDKFLRGELTVSYSPHQAPPTEQASGGLLTADEKSAEVMQEWIKAMVPEGVAQWTAAFLGIIPEGKTAPQLTDFDHWVNLHILPQLRDSYFKGVTQYFEQLANHDYAPSNIPASQFGFHCYKMYEGLKDPSADPHTFDVHLEAAQAFPQFHIFLEDYCTYLQANPPDMTPVALTLPPFVATPIQTTALVEAATDVPMTSSLVAGPSDIFTDLKEMTDRVVSYAQPILFSADIAPSPPISEADIDTTEIPLPIQAFLIERGSPPPDDITLAHIVGHQTTAISEGRVLNKSLEGMSAVGTIRYQLGIARDMLETLQNHPQMSQEAQDFCCSAVLGDPLAVAEIRHHPKYLQETIRQLEVALDIEWQMSRSTFRESMRERVDKLKEGETFFFPAGWTTTAGGHGTAFEVTRQDNGLLTIRHYNTGAGILYHTSARVGLQQRYLHFSELVDVEPENFTSRAFLSGLQNLRRAPIAPQKKMEHVEWDDADIYQSLLFGLGGKMSARQYSQADLKLPQYVGICAMESVMAALEKSVETEPSARLFRFWSTLKATKSYFDANISRFAEPESGEERRRLFDDALKALSARTQAVAEDGTITSQELHYVEGLLTEMRSALVEAECAAIESSIAGQAPIKLVITNEVLKVPPWLAVSYTSSREVTKELAAPRRYFDLQWSDWQPHPDTLATDLGRCVDELRSANDDRNNFFEVQRTVRQVALKVPLMDEGFWSEVDAASAGKVLASLTHLSQEVFISFLNSGGTRKELYHAEHYISSEDLLAQAKILSLIDLIVRRYPNDFDIPFPSLYQHSLRAIVDPIKRWSALPGSTPEYHLQERPRALQIHAAPEWEEEILVLGDYWKTQQGEEGSNKIDLFGFYWLPAGRLPRQQPAIRYDEPSSGPEEGEAPKRAPFPDKDLDLLGSWAKEHPERVSDLDPTWVDLPYREQAMKLMENMHRIPILHDVFTASYIYNFFLTGKLGLPKGSHFTSRDQLGRSVKAEVEKMERVECEPGAGCKKITELVLKYTLPEVQAPDGKIDEQIPADVLIDSHRNDMGALLNDVHAFGGRTGIDYWDRANRMEEYKGERLRLDPSLIVLFDPVNPYALGTLSPRYPPLRKEFDITVEELRKLLNLSAVKELQIPQVIGYFSQNRQKLFIPDYQIFFRLLLTEERLLEDWFLQSPKSADQLAVLFNKVLATAISVEDNGTAIFVAGMSQRVTDIYQRVSRQHSDTFQGLPPPALPLGRDIINALLQRSDLTMEQRALAHRERALTFINQTTLTAQEAIELLQSQIFGRTFKIPQQNFGEMDSHRDLQFIIRDRFPDQLRSLLQGPERDAILTGVLSVMSPDVPAQAWKEITHFYYQSIDGRIGIDILDGHIQISGERIPFDNELLQNPEVRAIFGDNPPITMIRQGNALYLDHQGYRYRLVTTSDKRTKMQRFINDKWCELQREGFHIVGSSEKPDFALSPALLVGMHCWYEGAADLLYVTDSISQQIKYRVALYTRTVQRVDDMGRPIESSLVSSTLPELEAFRRLEAPEYILAWTGSRNGVLEEVELPRFGLTFRVEVRDGRRQAVCEQLPGYALVEGERQAIAELGDYGNYLHLQKTEADGTKRELVVLARQVIKEQKEGTYSTPTETERGIDGKGKVVPQRHFEYLLQQGSLVPAASTDRMVIEANLYLAMIHFAEKYVVPGLAVASRYSEAKRLLDLVDQQLLRQRGGLDDAAIEVLEWVIKLPDITKDQHPDAIAIQLKAAFLLYRNNLDYSGGEPGSVEAIGQYYEAYLTHLDYIDKSLRLQPAEELLLLTSGLPSSSQLAHRLAQLTQETDKIGKKTTAVTVEPLVGYQLHKDELQKLFPITLGWNPKTSKSAKGLSQSPFPRNMDAAAKFSAYYALAKGEAPLSEAREAIVDGIGIDVPSDITEKELCRELATALRMHLGNPNTAIDATGYYKRDRAAAVVLLAALTRPEAFPDSLQIREQATKWWEINTELSQLLSEREKKKDTVEAAKEVVKKEECSPEETEALKILEEAEQLSSRIEELVEQSRALRDQVESSLIEPVKQLLDTKQLDFSIPISEGSVESQSLKQERAVARTKPLEQSAKMTLAQCIELRAAPHTTGHTLQEPVIPQEVLDQIVVMSSSAQEDVVSPETLFVVGSNTSSALAEGFAEKGKIFADYVASGKGMSTHYTLLEPSKLTEMQQALSETIAIESMELKEQESILLGVANKEHDLLGPRAEAKIKLHRGTEKLISLNEVVRSLYQRDYAYLQTRNPALTPEDVERLFVLVQDYLLNATHLNQQQIVLDKAQELSKALAVPDIGDIEIQESVRAFVDAANAKRHYDFREHPESLVFEFYTKQLIWESQIETLEAMTGPERLGALIELIMGGGKSSVVVPLLAWLNADGEHLAAIVMPEPLIDSMAKDLSSKFGTVFGQLVRTILIKREPITLKRITRLYDRLCEVRDNREVLLWTPTDIQSLFNQWVEHLETTYEETKGGAALTADAAKINDVFVQIFSLLGESGLMTVDEVHKVFDILLSHKFTFGEPQQPHPDISTSITHLFTTLSSPDMVGTVHWPFMSDSTGPTFTEERYQTEIKPVLVDVLIRQRIDPSDKVFKAFFEALTPDQLQLVRDYLLDVPKKGAELSWIQALMVDFWPFKTGSIDTSTPYGFLASLEGDAGRKIRNHLATLKEVLKTVLPVTAGRTPLVHYGPDGKEIIIIPYHDGRPVEGSLFGSVLERMLYTAQYAMAKRLPESVVRKELAYLRDEVRRTDENGEQNDKVLERFHELCDHNPKYSLKHLSDTDYAEITDSVNRNPKLVMDFVRKYRLPEIKIFNREIQSSAHLFPAVSKKESGLSGTLFNVPTLPWVFQEARMSDTEAKTLDILRRRSPPEVATLPKSVPKEEMIKAIYDAVKGPPGCIIEASGDTLGIGNEQLARQMLIDLPEAIKGVVFYEGDTLMVLYRDDPKPQLYDRKKVNRSEIAALWDISHCVGSDIWLGDFMTATMIVSRHTTLVDMMQTAWRMRGLAKGQTVNFMVSEEDRDFIIEMLREYLHEDVKDGENLTLDQLFRYQLLIQIQKESGNNYRAIQERMKMELSLRVLKLMWNSETPFQRTFDVFKDCRTLFVSETPTEPWNIWGAPTVEIPTAQALEGLLEAWKQSPIIATIKSNPELYKDLNIDELFASWDAIIHGPTGPLPDKTSTSQAYGTTIEQIAESQEQAQSLHETESETMQQSQKQSQQQVQQQVSLGLKSFLLLPAAHVKPLTNIFEERDSVPMKSTFLTGLLAPELTPEYFTKAGTAPCISANHALDNWITKANGLTGLCDNDLLLTLNLAPVHLQIVQQEFNHRPFGRTQKDCSFVQIIQHPDGRLQVKMLEVDDAADVRAQILAERLEAEQGTTTRKRDLRVGFLQIERDDLNLDLVGSQGVDISSPGKKERLLELIVQAKLLAGHTQYSEEQIPYLRAWLEKIGPEKGFKLLNYVLHRVARVETRNSFPTSKLAGIFEEYGVVSDWNDPVEQGVFSLVGGATLIMVSLAMISRYWPWKKKQG